jgi:hypothetical protein
MTFPPEGKRHTFESCRVRHFSLFYTAICAPGQNSRSVSFEGVSNLEENRSREQRPHGRRTSWTFLRIRLTSFYLSTVGGDHRSEFSLDCDNSKRNQVRCSVSSIQISIRLAVATSPCSLHAFWLNSLRQLTGNFMLRTGYRQGHNRESRGSLP